MTATVAEVWALRPTLLKFCIALTQDHSTGEDLCSDTILKAIRYADKFTPRFGDRTESLRAWLFTIARNHRLEWNRRRAWRIDYFDPTDENFSSYQGIVPAAGPSVLDLQDTQRCIRMLTPAHQAILAAAAEGLHYDEMASALGLTLGTTKSRLNRARAKLRALLASQETPS